MDAGVEAKLRDYCYCTICTFRIYCYGHDHWCWLFGIAYRRICHWIKLLGNNLYALILIVVILGEDAPTTESIGAAQRIRTTRST